MRLLQLDTSKSLRAIFIAPLSAGIGWVIANAFSSDVANMLSLIFGILPLSYPFALIGTLVLGLPTYLIMKYLKVLNFYTLSLVGLPLGFLSAVFTGDLNDPYWLKTACITGLVVSTTAALVMLQKPNKINNENASSAGMDAQKDAKLSETMFLYQSYDDYKVHIEEKWASLSEGAKKLICPSRFSISNSSLFDSNILSVKITSKSIYEFLLDIEMEIEIALYEEPWYFGVKIIFEDVREFNLINSPKSTMPLNITASELTVEENGCLRFVIKTLVNEDYWYIICRDIKAEENKLAKHDIHA